jgi:prepilin-type N-terminal cleavage/methylation domain-containing protein
MIPRGFTLVELAAVVLLLGLVAAGVTLRLNDPLRRAGLDGAVVELEAFDHATRTAARQQDRPLRMVFDLDSGVVRRTDAKGRSAGAAARLPDGYAFERFRVAGKEVHSGRVSVTCSRQGLTPTYAFALEAPGHVRRWRVVAGLSGQVMEGEDEAHVRKTFASLGPRRDAG